MKLARQQTTLANGLRILSCAMPHTYSVGVGFYISVGSRYEEDAVAGAAHFLEHMFFKGTARRPSPQAIAAELEGNGGLYNASTARETTVLWTKVPHHHLDLALDVLSDMLRHSLMLPTEVEKERRVILEEINASHDVPEELASLVVHAITWPGHPLGRDIAGTPQSVSRLTHSDLASFFARHYHAGNTVVSVSGDVQHEQVVESVATHLADWHSAAPSAFAAAPLTRGGARVALIGRPTEQTHLNLHFPGLARDDEDRFALGLMNVILGESMSSRLFLEIREHLGLAYSVESYTSFMSDNGLVGIYAAVAPGQLGTALQSVLEQLLRLGKEAVADAELRVAKEFTKGRLLLGMEDTLTVAGWFGRQEIQGGPVLSVEEVIDKVEGVTVADVQRLAQRVFRSPGARLAVVGPHGEEEAAVLEATLAGVLPS